MLSRNHYQVKISDKFQQFKIVALLGARQVGKTTIAREYCKKIRNFPENSNYFDLEDPEALARLQNPKLTLENLSGLVVIDEIQRRPELFPTLRYLVDRPQNKLRFLILGSASRDLIQQSSESLAGRISYIEVNPLQLFEVKSNELNLLWLRGGYPKAFLAKTNKQTFEWLSEYVRTFLERDIPSLGIQIPSETLRRFWLMLVHNHGNILNSAEIARSFGVSDKTVKHYLDILSGTYMIRKLQPWFTNLKKRQVKSPKIYFRDSGILHYFMGVKSQESLQTHLKLGASWEGFTLEQLIANYEAQTEDVFFWGVHGEAELDLLIQKDGKLHGFEIKYTDSPKLTKSLKYVEKHLSLESLTLVAPVKTAFPIADNIWVKPLHLCKP